MTILRLLGVKILCNQIRHKWSKPHFDLSMEAIKDVFPASSPSRSNHDLSKHCFSLAFIAFLRFSVCFSLP